MGLAQVAERLGVADPDGDSEASARRLREELAIRTTPAVLVLDDANDPQLVRRCLPATGATRVIITSTDRAFTSLGDDVAVDVFERDQSVAYLAERTGIADEDGAAAVATELGDLPLALAQAATVIKLRGLTYDAYVNRLRSLPLAETLPADRGGDYTHAVANAILLSIDAVEAADSTGLTRRALAATALLAPEGVSRDLLAAILDLTGDLTRLLEEAITRLVTASLMVWAKDRWSVVMHRLVARAIRERLEIAGEFNAYISATGAGLRPLLAGEEHAWEQRHAGVEIVANATALWENAVTGVTRGVLSAGELQSYVAFAHWAVRHLRATADLSRAIALGASMLAACERVLGPDHPKHAELPQQPRRRL